MKDLGNILNAKSENYLTSPKAIVELCGGYSEAIDAIVCMSRILWHIVIDSDQNSELMHVGEPRANWKGSFIYRVIDPNLLVVKLEKEFPEESISLYLFKMMRDKKLNWTRRHDGKNCFHHTVLSPVALARELVENIRPDHELVYFVMKSIRLRYNCPLSPRLMYIFQFLAKTINNLPQDKKVNENETEPPLHPFKHEYNTNIINYCRNILEQEYFTSKIGLEKSEVATPTQEMSTQISNMVNCFFEVARAANYFRPSNHPNRLKLKTLTIDPEYIISLLFGVATGIEGLDDLFGGFGPVLPEEATESESDFLGLHKNRLKAKTIIIIGEIGSGKSILSLELAAAVARKGGIAWLLPLEQSPSECLYTLSSIGAFTENMPFTVATDVASSSEAIAQRNPNNGALIILQPDIGLQEKQSYELFLQSVVHRAESLKDGIRLLVVDPMNSIGLGEKEGKSTSSIRSSTMRMIEKVKECGTNVLLVLEESKTFDENQYSNELLVAQNIADTVIRLSVKRENNYAQRCVEIVKSRMQREQRGVHSFSIIQGEGIHVYPSSASVAARIRTRQPLRSRKND